MYREQAQASLIFFDAQLKRLSKGEIRLKTNILIITVDDMNWNTPGCFEGMAPDVTPNIDRLAAEGLMFENGHVNVAVCQPSRTCMMTGLYSHNSGGEGFYRITKDKPLLVEALQKSGYLCGIVGKLSHSTPKESFEWDVVYDMDDLGKGRDPELYFEKAGKLLERAKKEGKPFFLMGNSHDPHRPFYQSDQEKEKWPGQITTEPSRVYTPDEVTVPGFLPDIPDVRREIAEYCSSSRRADDSVGRLLDAIDQYGFRDNTIVIFLSDNGMAFPFAKTNCYLNSTKTPLMVRWPEKVKAGVVDSEHFVSGIDIMPSLLDIIGIELEGEMDGTSFLPLLENGCQEGLEFVYTQFHQTAARRDYPMRCVQNKKYGYILNKWSDGETVFKNESQGGLTFHAMVKVAEEDPAVAERVKLFQYRVPEEFYDLENDPNALDNLIDDPEYSGEIDKFRNLLKEWADAYGDTCL